MRFFRGNFPRARGAFLLAASDRAFQSSTIERPRWWPLAAAAALLTVYFLLAVTGVAHKSTTFDEVFHLTGGYSYWKFGDFRMQPENGNLPQRWAALPLVFGDYKFPSVDSGEWRRSSVAAVGGRFVYGVGNDADRMLLSARAMIALMGVALGALVFAWSWRLLGLPAALVSLTLFAFCPTLLANGSLATSDMAAALFFLASVGAVLARLESHHVGYAVGQLVGARRPVRGQILRAASSRRCCWCSSACNCFPTGR